MTSPERERRVGKNPSLALRAGKFAPACFLWAIFFVLTFLHLLRLPTAVHSPGLDESWQQCLGYFFLHRFQAGVDYVWTYGPLGNFATQSYNGDLFWSKYAWEVAVNLVLAALLTRLGQQLPSRPFQIAYVLLVLITEPRWDTYYLAALVWPVILVLRADQVKQGVLAALGFWLAVLALVKFTWLLIAALAWLSLVVGFRKQQGRRIEAMVGFPLAISLLWLALGQAPGHFVPYLAASWQIAAGYGEAMAADGPAGRVVLALSILLALILLAVISVQSTWKSVRPLLGLALLGVSVLLTWKHGFTRQLSHDVLFFGFVALVPFAGVALVSPARQESESVRYGTPEFLTAALTVIVVVLSLLGRGQFDPSEWSRRFITNMHALVSPLATRDRCQREYDTLAGAWALPRLSAIVGTETVDQLSCDQGVVLLNHWNYRPRPVFQSYSAYSPRLLADNAAFFLSDRAPRFLLWSMKPIDDRLPTSEDGPALLVIFRLYRLVAEEKGFLLLERRSSLPGEGNAREIVREGTVVLNEEMRSIELPGSAHVVRLFFEDTAWGKVRKLFFRPPELFLRVRTLDGIEESYRLIPALASAGFLLDPLLRDDEDMKEWLSGGKVPRLVSFAVIGSPACYNESIRVVIERADDLPGGR